MQHRKLPLILFIFIYSLLCLALLPKYEVLQFDNNTELKKLETYRMEQTKNLVLEQELTEKDEWKCNLELPKYNEMGELIIYEVDEKEVPQGYEKIIDGNVITNKRVDESNKISIEEHTAVDNNNLKIEEQEGNKYKSKLPVTGKDIYNYIILKQPVLAVSIVIVLTILIIFIAIRIMNKD